jgi:hypothetical protein
LLTPSLIPPDTIIIAHPKPKVKYFGKNKKIIIFAKTLDKMAGAVV